MTPRIEEEWNFAQQASWPMGLERKKDWMSCYFQLYRKSPGMQRKSLPLVTIARSDSSAPLTVTAISFNIYRVVIIF